MLLSLRNVHTLPPLTKARQSLIHPCHPLPSRGFPSFRPWHVEAHQIRDHHGEVELTRDSLDDSKAACHLAAGHLAAATSATTDHIARLAVESSAWSNQVTPPCRASVTATIVTDRKNKRHFRAATPAAHSSAPPPAG